MKTKELIKTWYYNQNRITNYVRERLKSWKCIIVNTDWVPQKKSFIMLFEKSKFKYKEILPMDKMDYVWATTYMIIK